MAVIIDHQTVKFNSPPNLPAMTSGGSEGHQTKEYS